MKHTFARTKASRSLGSLALGVIVALLLICYRPANVAGSITDFEGSFDSATCSVISGWAWDKTLPNTPINVDVYVDGMFLTTVTANQFRQDLLDAGKGNGFHAFVLPTPASLVDGVAHSIQVKIANSSIELSNSPKSLTCNIHDFRGSHDRADCDFIAGWAWDANFPDDHISVFLFVDGNAFASLIAPANQFRPDLLDAGIGDGTHAFAFQTPAFLKDGQPHSIRVTFAPTTTPLDNTPKSINCSAGPTEPDFHGSHDGADCNVISGWAWDANNPDATISVDIYSGPTLIATVPADKFRQDLLDAGIGNGFHAFVFPVPNSLKDDLSHSISVGFAGTLIGLVNTPRTITCTDHLDGALDAATCESISGWAWDSNQPNTPISVDIFSDNMLIATVPADLFRQDLLDAGKGNGFHAFAFPVPPPLKDGTTHTIVVKVAGTAIQLQNSPATVACSPQFDGSLDGATCTFISGWAWDIMQPTTPINVDIYSDNVLIATVAADQFRQDLLDAGKGNGIHAFVLATPPSLKDGIAHTIVVKIAGTPFPIANSPRFINCPAP